MAWLTHDRYLAALRSETGALVETLRGADAAARVPDCPEWTVEQLAAHVGQCHGWALGVIEGREDPDFDPSKVADPEAPEGLDAVQEWLESGVRAFVGLLAETGPDTPCWTWSPVRRTGFWARRMAHETLVHRHDAAVAAGREFIAEPELAADCAAEFLENIQAPRMQEWNKQLAELRGTGETLHLHCTDVPGEWLLRLGPDGFTVEAGHAKADTAVRGTAQQLMLLINRRLPGWETELEIFGDPALVRFWLDRIAWE